LKKNKKNRRKKNMVINSIALDKFKVNFLENYTLICDAPVDYQFNTQDPGTDVMEWMVDFYDLIMVDLIVVVFIILYLLTRIILDPVHHHYTNRAFSHSTPLEIFWTVVPAIILVGIAYPSFNLLYALDDLTDPVVTLKVIGHQWYWSYEQNISPSFSEEALSYDSYIIPTDDLKLGMLRLLEVDNRVVLPLKTHIRLLITSADVLHSWAVPSLGIKVDACPGRLNQATLYIKRPGLYFGQCSEICGVNHGFMPIVVMAIPFKDYNSEEVATLQPTLT
jgi:cytochrome c oxidase subunit 2